MKRISNNIRNWVDNYLVFALPIDFIIIILLWILNSKFSLFEITYNEKFSNLDIVANIIGASISLAGFILASLTIIVAIRANIQNKSSEKAETPLELFFSVGTFKTIVKVFKISIIELVICFITSFIILIIAENLTNEFIFKVIVSSIFLMSLSTIRSLFVLFLLIKVNN